MDQEYKNKIKDFTDLTVWQKGHSLVLDIYKVTEKFPQTEIFGLTSQIRRAVVSITSNIAEGFGRQSYKEKTQFYYIAYSSIVEVRNQLLIAHDIGYIKSEYAKISEQLIELQKILQGLIKKTKEFYS